MSLFWFLVGVALFSLIYIFHPLLLSYLHLTDPLLLILVGLGVGISYISIVNVGFLQSLMKFRLLALNQVVGAFAKIIFGVAFVLAGTRAVGGLAGFLMMPLFIYLLGFFPLRKLITSKSENEEKLEIGELLKYGLLASAGLIALSSFISTDVILVKHFFTEVQAGLYGGLSIVGKAIYYLTVPIGSVMFPIIVKRRSLGQKYKNVYLLSLILVFLPSIAATLFYYLFSVFTAKLFLGGYLEIAKYLWLFGLFITLFNLTSLTTNFFLSLKKTNVSFIVIFFALLQIVLIYLFHADFYHVIYSSIISLSLLLLTLGLYYKIQKD